MGKIFVAVTRTINTDPGYSVRSEQVAMARNVASALQDQQTLIVEAGTGTGKTFAYLSLIHI